MRNLALRSVSQAVNPAFSVNGGSSLADGLKICYVPIGQYSVRDLTGRTQPTTVGSYGTVSEDGPYGPSTQIYYNVGSDHTLLSGLASLSISALFKFTSLNSTSTVVRKWAGFELGVTYAGAGTEAIYFTTYVGSNGQSPTTNSASIVAGKWYHCLVIQKAGVADVYLNGKYAFTVTPPGSVAPVFDYSYETQPGYFRVGPITNISIWNRALTGGEIARLAANPLAMLDSGKRWFAGVGASSSYSQTYSASSTASASRIRLVGIPRSGSAGSATTLNRAITQSAKSATSSGTATGIRAIVRGAIAATSSAAVSQIRAIARAISASSAGTATYSRALARSVAATASSSASTIRSIAKSASASSGGSATAAIAKQLYRAYSATVSSATSIIRSIGTTAAASAGSASLMAYGRILFRSAAATAASAVSAVRSAGKIIAASSAGAASILGKQIYRAYSASSASSPAIVRAISRTASAASSGSSAAMAYGRILFRAATATVSSAATMATSKIFGRVFSAASTTAASIGQRSIALGRSATASATVAIGRVASLFRTISTASVSTASLIRAFSKAFSATASSLAFAAAIFLKKTTRGRAMGKTPWGKSATGSTTSGAAAAISLLRRVFVPAEHRTSSVDSESRRVIAEEDRQC